MSGSGGLGKVDSCLESEKLTKEVVHAAGVGLVMGFGWVGLHMEGVLTSKLFTISRS